jgi:signal transduction histidine kinase
MRRMVGGLRNAAVHGSSWDEIDLLIANAVDHGEPIRAEIDPEARITDPAVVLTVHRVIAESLTNVRRHAREVKRIEVAVQRRSTNLIVSVHNNGRSSSMTHHADSGAMFGIIGLKERVMALGGSLVAGPTLEGGWLVQAELPLEPLTQTQPRQPRLGQP